MTNFSIEAEIDQLFRDKMAEFAKWAADNWRTSASEAEQLLIPTKSPEEYARGYNDGIASIPDALDCWLEEYGL